MINMFKSRGSHSTESNLAMGTLYSYFSGGTSEASNERRTSNIDVDLRYTKLSSEEIEKISQKVATDWYELAYLLEIPFKQRHEIFVNHESFPNPSAKAKRILKIFNERTDFDRHLLKKYLGEIYLDLDEILAPTKQFDRESPPFSKLKSSEYSYKVDLRYTKLSSEEIEKISQKVATDWNTLGALLEIPFEQRHEIFVNHKSFRNPSAKAKRILKIFNERTDFDRHLLKKYLGEIYLDLDEILAPTKLFDRESPPFSKLKSSEYSYKDEHRYTKLTPEEIEKISQKVATEWNGLGCLLEIPSFELKKISSNHVKYPDPFAKSKKILEIFNEQTNFDRHLLNKCLKKLYLDLDKILSPPKQILKPLEASSARLYEGKIEARKERRNPNIDDDPRYTKLTPEEIEKISQKIATEWIRLGFLLEIPSVQLKEIYLNHVKYPDPFAKSKKILEINNEQKKFDRRILNNCLKQLHLDLDKILSSPKQILHKVESSSSRLYEGTSEDRKERRKPNIDEVTSGDDANAKDSPGVENAKQADLRYTELTTEEIEKIGQKVGTDWNILGGLLEIPFEQRDEITVDDTIYPNPSARAKAILVIFNEGKKFDRYVLKICLKEIKLDLDEILSPTNQFDGKSQAFKRIKSFSSLNKDTKAVSCELEKLVTSGGGNLMMEDVIFDIGPGCLEDSTMIKLVKWNSSKFSC
ncbi:uncharacterized protein LOC124449811 isoform X2 [Xenia sp. Carnegie-2017]|uniref:uncharacterized protein LOC124449811 isoform X2 n=2 Tax=Xenia sp. Carnegie-2017 TaxID=2897299 RepID=UPI001F04F004|nr:uncharacterized protein LOC124449811 isoform X2 [Xenia sp. Carnegie-2017]